MKNGLEKEWVDFELTERKKKQDNELIKTNPAHTYGTYLVDTYRTLELRANWEIQGV